MSFDVHRVRAMATNLENRIATVGIVYPIVTSLVFFILSYTVLINGPTPLDRAMFAFVGAVFGRMFSALTKHTLEERRTVLAGYIDLYNTINKSPVATVPETVPSQASEAVEKVEIPAEPKLPNIPSVAAPEDVKAALKAAKGKGKLTKLPPKRKAKTVPPAQA